MDRWRRTEPQLEARIAGRLLDEALRVFGLLEASAVADPAADEELRVLLGIVARDLLDDVACLSHLAAPAAAEAAAPGDPSEPPLDEVQPLVCRAVNELATYTLRLAATAIVLSNRSEGATELSRMAAAAEARMAFLAS